MKKQCYLCGDPADSHDHVPPRGFFPKPWPDNLLTVPCCTKCNNGFSGLDERMRIMFASDEHANESAKLIAKQKIFSENSVKGREFRAIASTLQTVLVKLNGVIQPKHKLSAQTSEVHSFVERVVRGLIHEFYPELHDPKGHVMVECISTTKFKDKKNEAEVQEVINSLSRFVPHMNRNCFGKGVLDFMHVKVDGGSAWILSFYCGVTFFAVHSVGAPPLNPYENK